MIISLHVINQRLSMKWGHNTLARRSLIEVELDGEDKIRCWDMRINLLGS
jgi:hypothetical protein